MINILFMVKRTYIEKRILEQFMLLGCKVTKYDVQDCLQQEDFKVNLQKELRRRTYHFICSVGFDEDTAHAAYNCGTKYVSIQYDNLASDLYSPSVAYPTNYIFFYDAAIVRIFREQGINTVYMLDTNPSAEEIIQISFTEEEIDIYESMLETEKYWLENGRPVSKREHSLEEVYRSFAKEKDYLFPLKEKLLRYIGKLIASGKPLGWEEIIVWFNRNVTKELRGYFWEFYILYIIADVYKQERNIYSGKENGMGISVLKFKDLEEIYYYYFKLIFMFRRIEYDLLPETHYEICSYVQEKGLSDIFIGCILYHGQIEDKIKVESGLRELFKG